MICYINNIKQNIKIKCFYKHDTSLPIDYRRFKYLYEVVRDKTEYIKISMKTNQDFYTNYINNKDIIDLDIEVNDIHELKTIFPKRTNYKNLSNDNHKNYIVQLKVCRTTITSTYKDGLDIIIICGIISINEQPLQYTRNNKLSNLL